jgi:hypothetical protein
VVIIRDDEFSEVERSSRLLRIISSRSMIIKHGAFERALLKSAWIFASDSPTIFDLKSVAFKKINDQMKDRAIAQSAYIHGY